MIDKVVASTEAGLEGLADGMTILVGGFNDAGMPKELLKAALDTGARGLTVVANGAGMGDQGLAALILNHRVGHVICSFPSTPRNDAIRDAVDRQEVVLEVCPQGSVAERMRAAGAGLGGVLTPTGVGTELAQGKPVYELDGRTFLVERPIHGDFALIRAWRADRMGNLLYRYAQRNFNHVMAMAAACTVVQADHIDEPGAIEPMAIHTPGIYVKRVVQVDRGTGR
ncbi:MAG: 3-oxoacid CoA-transferase subunit A [Chloroflexota bacterium]|nr:3-oxoacid CoA-transferase subunit A [Chloroflexota bacterium]